MVSPGDVLINVHVRYPTGDHKKYISMMSTAGGPAQVDNVDILWGTENVTHKECL